MKIAVINGQNHKGSTYHIGKQVADKLGGEVTEFFLPRDFGDFCVGCTQCFLKSETLCPHYERLKKITEVMDEADVLIFTTPVYVYHCTGSMKAFLDHYGYRWMVHRPEQKMFTKQAVVISTAAGSGTKSASKDIADSMFFWGIPKTYRYGVNVRAINYSGIRFPHSQSIA
jgi:multimeric flavodoxin WrbA